MHQAAPPTRTQGRVQPESTEWTRIPGKLKAAGFTIFFDRISYEPENPLWRVKASRGGRQLTALGRDLATAFLELENSTQIQTDWRKTMRDASGGREDQEHTV